MDYWFTLYHSIHYNWNEFVQNNNGVLHSCSFQIIQWQQYWILIHAYQATIGNSRLPPRHQHMRHDCMGIPSHMPETSEMCLKHTPYIVKMSVRGAVYHTSHFKRFFNLNIIDKLSKGNNMFIFIVYFIQMKVFVFSLKHMKTSHKKWFKIQLKQFNTQPFHSWQLWTEKFQVEIFTEPNTSLWSWKS